MDKPFIFKQFTIKQDRCAMKIGTDAVLLGAWTPLNNRPSTILDIGAGTGVLSLMMAQRSEAETLDALEIDGNAYEQCVENFENSVWADRLFCYHASLQEFAEGIDTKYDLIICNPPFYSEDYKTNSPKRNKARFQDAMPFEHIVKSISVLMAKNGGLSIILPFLEEDRFIKIATKIGLEPKNICRVRGNISSEIKRSLIYFTYSKIETEITEMTIEISRHKYTKEYFNLTKDFYLKM